MALLLKEKCQMIQAKLKTCAGCNEPKHIWKSDGKDKYCKECWYKVQPPKSMPKQTKKPNANIRTTSLTRTNSKTI